MSAAARSLLVGFALAAGFPFGASAQTYPTRPVTLIVPYAPGGTTDAIARKLGHRLEQRLGKPFIIENRPGAATLNASAYVARAAGDGYTLLLGTSSTFAINVSIYKSLPYDPVKDFAPVALVAEVPFMLTVNPGLPVRSIADLVAYSKTHKDGLAYASTGHGSVAHLFVELLKTRTGIEAMHVPYKGVPAGLNDVVAGHVQMMIGDFNTSNQLFRGGKVRALGVTTGQRVPAAADIPTIAEGGLPGYDAAAWQMIVAPASTPDAIVTKLNTELRAILQEPEVLADFTGRGLVTIVTPPPAELKSYVVSEIARWSEVVKKAGATGIE